MVANVWKVVAAEGDHVDDGDTLVILESMKMEIPVLAEGPGVVTEMHVAEGARRRPDRHHQLISHTPVVERGYATSGSVTTLTR